MRVTRDRPTLAITGAILVSLGASVGIALWPAPPVTPVGPGARTGDRPGIADQQAAILAVEAYAAVFERPIFNRGRLPDPPPPSPPSSVPTLAPLRPSPDSLRDLRLVGIAISNGDRLALLRRENEDVVLRLRAGDMLGEWRVGSVDQAAVVFQADDQVFRIEFPKLPAQ
ncbi:hypothetical protein D3874_27350 [Oleomonas cavernae]|uniref:Type II secretion system protein GspC N-terminal domain-containing protein n=1 Tax=Oleomonas cavernae TaxID=2320859 RepID=A0A418VUG2_9PROT|nr:hypothetical protein [Oleomonas cavernae]RJF80801.1 hypothetical protein D3874_27350 [Oleomonas cavernae]